MLATVIWKTLKRCCLATRTIQNPRRLKARLARSKEIWDSPAHAKSFDCNDCNRPFGSKGALEQHKRDSPAHQHAPEPQTPLDIFFHSFPTFKYDPSQPPATSYARLQAHKRWRSGDDASGDAASDDAWNRYQHALEGELYLWYGKEDDLAAWHALCHAVGVEPPPQTCDQCEQVRAPCAQL
jgi:hypothetical protein